MSDKHNGKSPLWLQVITAIGLPAFLLMWLMGAFDGWISSPVTAALHEHEKNTTQLLRQICYGIWRDEPHRCN